MIKILNWIISKKIFILRSIIFFSMVIALFIGDNFASKAFNFNILFGIRVYHLLWLILMAEMILVFFPQLNHFVGCGKLYSKYFIAKPYNKTSLKKYLRKYNIRSLYVFIIWMGFLGTIKLLNLSTYFIIILTISLYFLDQVFVNVWCPFKHLIMKNKCCATCRIYNWGFPMLSSPLIFINSFFSYSLVFVSIVLITQWEYQHLKFPERFSEISNDKLKCINCSYKCKKVKEVM